MKILTVIGARPQFIKAAVLSRAFKEHRQDVEEIIVHTGQHYDANMSNVFFDELDIPNPAHNLGVGGGSHGENTGRMLEKLEALFLIEEPDWVLVYGDTDSTLAAALAASKLHVPVAHVEAGLRSFNRRMPEEINRVLTDHMATLLFAPTETARVNLLREGIAAEKIHVLGDVMYDAALFYKARASEPAWFAGSGITQDQFVLCTVHRAENTNDPARMEGILNGLSASNLPVVLPLHPRTRGKLSQAGLAIPGNVTVVDPVGYLEMVWLEAHCKLIATDSGGVQKEAYFHRKPCVTLRDETEWIELVECRVNTLVGTNANAIEASILNASLPADFDEWLYGDGNSGMKIALAIL
ncbi:non-hydrolyzing UDP-N-acetylglucosamine 2-epimerase [Variovorax sp. W2I14]|uniref:non-hydrolyzing UDP-N-acetylglucosamine 2-epimerase n=1 Tax=Variovorax sp. W2I14 TaxID=3042290 RepID=UPI003D1B0789